MPATTTPAVPAATPDIGFIGLGEMGGPMARRLATLGFRVHVHDIDARAVESAVKCGAIAAGSAREVAMRAPIVFTCLPSLPALRSVALGPEGLHLGTAIRTYVDLSTTGSHFARELADALAARGIRMLDAPITGNVHKAADGTLGMMCSGPREAFDEAEPVMMHLAATLILYLGGETGKAQTLKLLNNLLSATGMAASCEAFVLGVKAGLDPETMLRIVNAGEASSSATRNKFPRCILPRRFDFGARMAITIKDVTTTLKEADELGVPLWVAPAVRQLWAFAISQGASDRDGTSLITYLEPWAGVEVRGSARGARDPVLPATPPGADSGCGEFLFVCEAGMRAALAARLRRTGASVVAPASGRSRGGANRKPAAGGGGPRCRIVARAADRSVGEIVAATLAGRAGRGIGTVVNLCPTSRRESAAVAGALRASRVAWLDVPVTGTARDARAGRLVAIVSGPRKACIRAHALLGGIAAEVFHVGTRPGSAQVMHQINGALSSTLLAVTCEAFATGCKAGLAPETMTRIMGIETGRNAASAVILPQQVATRRFDHGKRIGEAVRELTLLSDEARALGVPTWIADRTRLLYALAANLGSPRDDITRLAMLYEKWANTQIRPGAPAA